MYKQIYEIILYLEDIKGYVSSYINYLNNPNSELDKKEIDMYLSIIPEITNKLIKQIERIYIYYEEENN